MRPVSLIAVLVAVAILPRLGLFTGELSFIWDDEVLLVEEERTASLSSIPGYFVEPYFEEYPETGLYRPMVNVTLTIERVLFGEGAVRAHRAVNLLLHLAATALLWGLIRRWRPERAVTAVIAAVLFAAHPAATEVIGWIAARGDSGAAVFSLLALHLWLYRTTAGWLGSMASFLVALFFKPVAVVVPAVIALIELREPGRRGRDLLRPRLALPILLYAIPVAIVFLLRSTAVGSFVPQDEGVVLRDARPGAHALLALGLLTRNLVRIVWPIGLTGDYQPEPMWRAGAHDLSLVWLVAALAVPILLAALVLTWRRSGLGGFGVAWAILFLLPVLQIVPIGALLADRFLYLPAMGAAIAGAAALDTFGRRAGGGALRWPLGVTVGILASCLSAIGIARAPAYADDGAFNRRVLERYEGPGWSRSGLAEVRTRLGLHHEREAARAEDRTERDRRRRAALAQYERAHELNPDSGYTLRRLGAMRASLASSNEAFVEARSTLMRALPKTPEPHRWKVWYEVARCLVRAHEWATNHARGVTEVGPNPVLEAETYLSERVLSARPDLVPALRLRGRILVRYLGRPEEGKEDLLRVAELDPSQASWVNEFLDASPNVTR